MKVTTTKAALGSAVLFLAAAPCAASSHQHQHRHHHTESHKRHEIAFYSNDTVNPRYDARNDQVQKRSGAKCEFPADKGLFAVTPSGMNAGWAMAPDQECVDGQWCPIACPSGQVMNQWKPNTHYTYPDSTCGGVYCNGGEIEAPFDDKPWCVDGTGAVNAVNKCGDVVSFCQTVLPGYEDMIIPTDVTDTATLAVPDLQYWDETAAHYYINAPGISADEGCHWGDESKPVGNWAPFVAGANTDGDGNTFVKLGLNPVWQSSGLSSTKPTFGLKIECPDGNCNGMPCSCDGDGVISADKATGAGGSDFCVVTVPSGSKANIVVYNLDGSEGSGSSSSTAAPKTTSSPVPTSTSTPTPSTTSTSTPTTSSTSSSTSTSSSSAVSTSSSSSSSSSSSLSLTPTSTSIKPSKSAYPSISVGLGGVFQQNGTASATHAVSGSSTSNDSPVSTGEGETAVNESNASEGAGQRQGGGAAVAGLIVAFVAAVYML
ncbi:beta-glucosidase-domain-containing protein [Xylariaceae sp. FL0016]|nr:beta-glucosidase-domain-containing protein [Xylariaceae sp. FL0016]